MFALGLPGMSPLMRNELKRLGATDVAFAGNDGRSDVVEFSLAAGQCEDLSIGTAEDVFVSVSTVQASRDLRQLASRLVNASAVDMAERSFAVAAGRPLPKRSTARVIARVTDERNFKRTDLRFAATRQLDKVRPDWRHADPAQAEIWLLQTGKQSFISGIRITTKEQRQRGGRSSERQGALRPSVAAAMLDLLGTDIECFVDPCCGSGTLLMEARRRGWVAAGLDIDHDAVKIASENSGAPTTVADVRNMPIESGSVDAIGANLPFGRQFAIEGDTRNWYDQMILEFKRVLKDNGRCVLLVPKSKAIFDAIEASSLKLERRYDIELLGTRTSIWALSV